MSTADVMTRLQLCWAEVPNIQKAFLYEPEMAIEQGLLPTVYPVLLGRQVGQTPDRIPGAYQVQRQYVYRVLIAAAEMASIQDDSGAYVDKLAVEFIDCPTDYFMSHPRLETSALGALSNLAGDISISDSGVVFRLGPGGAQYRAVDYTLTVAERRYPAIPRLA